MPTPIAGKICRVSRCMNTAGSLPISDSGNWMTAIQNTMPKVVSVAVNCLVVIIVMA